MKNRMIRLCMLVVVLAGLSVESATAQAKKPVRKTTKRTTTTTKKSTTKNNNAKNNAALTPAKDTVPAVAAIEPEIKIDSPKPSLRNDYAFERLLVKDRMPLAYEHIREDDATYVQRVWREIDIHEKMNLPFAYKADGDEGNQRFIMILLNAIKKGEVTAFSAVGGDDRFTTPITFKEIAASILGKPIPIQVPDWAKDPDGSKGIMKDSIVTKEFNPDLIERFWVKEDWIFDKESSRLHTRILGIAPLLTIKNDDESFRAATPIFWVYYPDLRPMLARFEVYNAKNFGARMSWEELFESRMFASRIIKSTVANPNDAFISAYIKDPILALLEGENIKDRIFNYEQDLWSY